MLTRFCPDCDVLFGQLHPAITEADAIIVEAGTVIQADKPSEHVDEWRLIRERWEKAHKTWVLAAMNLKNHVVTTHQSTPPAQEHRRG